MPIKPKINGRAEVESDNDSVSSILTTTQLIRELSILQGLFESKFSELLNINILKHQIVETRLVGMDKAITLIQNQSDRLPLNMDEKIKALREINEERFMSITLQFKDRDILAEQLSNSSKVAVDAALQAAKEVVGEQNKSSALAIAKSEASTVKQIDQQAALIQQMIKIVDDKFNDVKDRITRIEGNEEGNINNTVNNHASNRNTAIIIGVVMSIVGALVSIGSLIVVFTRH